MVSLCLYVLCSYNLSFTPTTVLNKMYNRLCVSDLPALAQFMFHPLTSPLSLFYLVLCIELTSNVKLGKISFGNKENFFDSDSRESILKLREVKCHHEYMNVPSCFHQSINLLLVFDAVWRTACCVSCHSNNHFCLFSSLQCHMQVVLFLSSNVLFTLYMDAP